jgi:hypothetical protein
MQWKNWPSWLKGGFAGASLVILFAVTAYIAFMLFEIKLQDFPPFTQINDFVGNQCSLMTQCRGQGCLVCIIWIPVLSLVDFFLWGALIGWIYKKMKERKTKNLATPTV